MMPTAIRIGLAGLIFVAAGLSARSQSPELTAGSQAVQQSRWDDAIRLLSQVITAGGQSGADLAAAHVHRGYAYFAVGQDNKAITDYTAAIRLAPKDAEAHSLRGWTYFTEGRMKQAIADSTAALRLDPNLAFAFRNRGRAQLYSGQARAAVDDFAVAARLAPSDVLGAIWLHIARVRAGQADQQEFAANIAKIDRRTWPGPIADVLSGAITPDQLGDIAMSSAGDKPQPERVCDARVYLGLLQLAAGDKDEARKLFQAADECPSGVTEATERAVAKMELKRLGAVRAAPTPKPVVARPAPAEPRSEALRDNARIREQSPTSPTPLPSFSTASADSVAILGTIDFNSDPLDAWVATSLGSGCTTPCSMEISAAEPFTVTFTRQGYAPSTIDVRIQPGQAGVSNATFSPNPIFVRLAPANRKAADREKRTSKQR
jgi:lipoprotein NlpI